MQAFVFLAVSCNFDCVVSIIKNIKVFDRGNGLGSDPKRGRGREPYCRLEGGPSFEVEISLPA